MTAFSASADPIAVARFYVTRTDGRREVHYSHDHVPVWRLRRWLRLRRHLRFMRREDKHFLEGSPWVS